MRFLRQLAAVSLTVAVIVALGVAWSRAGGTGLDGRGRPGPHATAQLTPRELAARQAAFRRKDGFGLGDPKSLERTMMAEAVLTTIVVAVSSTRRRRRQARRHTLSSASP